MHTRKMGGGHVFPLSTQCVASIKIVGIVVTACRRGVLEQRTLKKTYGESLEGFIRRKGLCLVLIIPY